MSIGTKLSQPEIIMFPETKLVGIKQWMSFNENTTPVLWKEFMGRRAEINHKIATELFSVQQYPHGFFSGFNPTIPFEKWAAVAVGDFTVIPEGMEILMIPEGRYAVFHYKGNPQQASAIFCHIFAEWLPGSGFELDNRLHFEILGEKYKNGADESEEHIYIPVR